MTKRYVFALPALVVWLICSLHAIGQDAYSARRTSVYMDQTLRNYQASMLSVPSPLDAVGLRNASDLQMWAFSADRGVDIANAYLGFVGKSQLGPSTLAGVQGQLSWPVRTVWGSNLEYPLPLRATFAFLPAGLRDLEMANQGKLTPLTSSTLAAMGQLGVSELRHAVDRDLIQAATLKTYAKWTYGFDDLAIGFGKHLASGSLAPNIEVTTHYLDALNATAWGFVGGAPAAEAAEFAAVMGRMATYPLFMEWGKAKARAIVLNEYSAVREMLLVHGQPVPTMAELYGAKWLRGIGFGPEVTGLAKLDSISTSVLRHTRTHRTPINTIYDDGFTRITRSGVFTETRGVVLQNPSLIDRVFFALDPMNYYDPNATTYYRREFSGTTITTTSYGGGTGLGSGGLSSTYGIASSFPQNPWTGFGNISPQTANLLSEWGQRQLDAKNSFAQWAARPPSGLFGSSGVPWYQRQPVISQPKIVVPLPPPPPPPPPPWDPWKKW